VGAASPPLVHSCGGDGVADVQDLDVEGPSVEVLFCFRRDLAGSSEEWRLISHL
jgi:hypothetical protein